ncbi:MAG: HlyD family secretion protein [Flavobacteriaceae bacterium]|jgi:membrane fusion protein (multidrug efflux system)|nr:HlyD family secretion protein [Flavobacteriaceae bacterium]
MDEKEQNNKTEKQKPAYEHHQPYRHKRRLEINRPPSEEEIAEAQENEKRKTHLELLKKRRRNILVNTFSILVTLLGLGWTIHYFWRYYEYEITNDATIEEYITPVNSKVSGYIKNIYFTEHQKVKSGDTLVVLDDREFKIKLLDAEASLKDAEASKDVLYSNIETSENTVSVSEANIAEAKVRMDNAYRDYVRYENLLKEESVPQQQFDQKKTEYEALKAKYNSLIMQKKTNESTTVGMSKKQENMDALILRSGANVEMAKLNLSYTVITAPYNGYVGRKTIETGELVQSGQTLTNIIKDNNKWVTANYKEKQIANIYIGQKVRIRIDAFPDKVFEGKVTAISEATGSKYSLIPTDNSAGNFVKIQQRIPVKIEFVNLPKEYKNKIRVGMMVETEAFIN